MLRQIDFQLLLIFIALLLHSSCEIRENEQANTNQDDILWYSVPSANWNEALPLGNGKLGAMVFGDPKTERIQLNDDSLWPSNKPDWIEPSGRKSDLTAIRSLLFEGKKEEADAMFVEKFSNKTIVRSHQTLGDLFIEFQHDSITDYRRELNISNAISKISYKTNGHAVRQEVFVSKPGKTILIRFTSESPNGLNAKIKLSRPLDEGYETVQCHTNDNRELLMEGQVTQRGGKYQSKSNPILEGVKFETRLKIDQIGGELEAGADYLELRRAKTATFYIVSNSSYYFDNYTEQNEIDLKHLEHLSFDEIKEEHISDYQRLYDRLDFDLGGHVLDSMPTDKRLEQIQEGKQDPALEALLFQYGRYLLISSSRKGSNPANLQGLWNEHIAAPWNADYHLNINLQMNYWLADVTNLGELNSPLFNYIDKLIENGKTTAKVNFGCGGTFIPHATDLWAATWLRAPTAYWGCSVGAGGWLVQHYWQHYTYTLDTQFLQKRAFPAIAEVAKFYSDWLIEDPRDGSLISAPSTSPENRYIDEQGKHVASCLGSAMDQQVIFEVFDHYIKSCEILQINSAFLDKIKMQKAKLRNGFVIDDNGRILEWDRPYNEPEPGHRHMSHLYGFHPGTFVTKARTPEIFNAVRKTLDYRLDNGGAGTGWSRAWLINCSARLLDGEMAHEHIQLMLQKSIAKNLFDMHPPFQIDGNFGYTAGLAEMLVQSHEDDILRILPAHPMAWKDGHIKGIKARNGLMLDVFWKENELTSFTVYPEFDAEINVHYQSKKFPISLNANEAYHYEYSKQE